MSYFYYDFSNYKIKIMANKIIGRENELQILDNTMASERAEFLAVYGRRRVGKTYLIYKNHISISSYTTLPKIQQHPLQKG